MLTKKRLLAFVMLLIFCPGIKAQNIIQGFVTNSLTKEPVPVVSVTVIGAPEGDYTKDNGNFEFKTNKSYPLTLVLSSIGYETKELVVNTAKDTLLVELNPKSSLGEEIVVFASRMAQKKLESPVTVERIGNKDIINSPQLNYFDMIQGLKGVDVTVSGIGFTTITTRGFNTSGSTNLTQLVDGMDIQGAVLNFPTGSSITLTQLDVDNIELLSGASSALYGSRGLSGTLVMTGKDPFKYQGLSILVTQGINHVKSKNSSDPINASPYYDWTIRWGKKVNDKLAFKINIQYTMAKDWLATDTTNVNGTGSKYTDPNYSGVNLYGGATSVDINPFLQYSVATYPDLAPLIDPLLTHSNYVARTGYAEYRYFNDNATLFKANTELRYKINPKLEAIVSGTIGKGSVNWTNFTRFQLRNFTIGQYRAELRAENWFFRVYASPEKAHNPLIAGPTAQLINEAWKPSYNPNTGDGWYPQYTGALIQGLASGMTFTNASLAARSYADIGRPGAGSPLFNHLKDSISHRLTSQGGTLFLDRSVFYNSEFQYHFSQLVKVIDVIAGLNWRLFNLNSKGTIFPDSAKPITMNEYSAYAQASKKIMNEKLSLAASFRFDKNSVFKDPKVTTRLSSVFEVISQNFIRLSFQNAYSFPSNLQALESSLAGVNSYLSGGSSWLLNGHYHFDQYPPYTLASVQAYQQTGDSTKLQRFYVNGIKPQSVNSFELGYSALINKKVLIDVLGYYSTWKNFLGNADVCNTPGTNDVTAFKNHATYIQYNITFNGAQTVNTYGYAAGVNVDLSHNFLAKANYFSDFLNNRNKNQVNNFNTPHFHVNLEFGNSGFGKKQNWSFNTSLRYKPSYEYYVSGGYIVLANGIVHASTVIDAQVGYKFRRIHSAIKIGGTNITNKYYSTGIANPTIGAIYYVSYAYNVF